MATYQYEDQDLDTITTLIRNVGEVLTGMSDAVHHDEALEEIVPDFVTALLQYEHPKRAMFQMFDTITRLVEDPDIIEAVGS